MDQFKSLLPEDKAVHCLDDLRDLTVKELKAILAAYKERMSGSKADLILRAYAIFSRLKQQVEPEISSLQLLQTTDEIACTYEDVFKLKCSHLPWTSDLRGTPAFSFIQLYDYLVLRTTKFKHIMLKSTGYKKLKSFQFFYEGYIKRIDVAKDSNFTFFDVRMKASMKSTLYKVLVVLDGSGNVSCAACTCPAGAGISGLGNCNHVGGVLFALEDFNRKGYKNCPEPVSCTSKLAAWNVPSTFASVSPASIDEVLIKKIRFGKDDVQLKAIKNICHDPRKIAHRRVDEERVEKLKHSLASSIPNSCFFAFHSFPDTSSASSSSIVTEMVDSLDSPFQDSFVNLSVSDTDSNSMAFSDDYDISCSNFKDMMDYHTKNNIYLPSTAILDIEKETRGQSSNSSWKQHRLYRITASNFYSAAVTTVEPSSKLNSMFYSSFSSVSTQHGKAYESHVRSLYLETLLRNGFNKVFVDVPGLIVSSTHSFLGASLDGIVKHGEDSWGLEIKCPYSKFSSSLHDAVADKKFFLRKSDVVELKKNHAYYYQIQGQMFCSGLRKVDLVVWFGDNQPLFIQSIMYDEHFVQNSILPQLNFFYRRAVLPEFFTKRAKRGLKLYLHGGWEKFSLEL